MTAAEVTHVTVLVPRTLMSVAGEQRTLEVEIGDSTSIAALLDGLAARYPVFDRRVRDETGAVRRYVNVYVDGEDIRQLDGVATVLEPGQQVRIIQSVAGG